MNILCACEYSQRVTEQLRLLGHNAFSCDILPASGSMPEYHLQGDCLNYINRGWDIIIAFPPCTYLSFAGNRHLSAPGRLEKRALAAEFFMKIINADCEHICVENPVGYMNSVYRKPDQIINPYDFGDSFCKRTCLWLKNLPLLVPDYQLPKPDPLYIQENCKRRHWVESLTGKDRQQLRSILSPGIARAMAYQFTNNFYVM